MRDSDRRQQMSEYSRELARLRDDEIKQQQALELAQHLLQNTRKQILYIQSLMWIEKTGIKPGSELAATSSFMKEIQNRRATPVQFKGWDWDAHYTLHSVDVREGHETTGWILCAEGGAIGLIPEWVIVEMREVWLQKHPQPI